MREECGRKMQSISIIFFKDGYYFGIKDAIEINVITAIPNCMQMYVNQYNESWMSLACHILRKLFIHVKTS